MFHQYHASCLCHLFSLETIHPTTLELHLTVLANSNRTQTQEYATKHHNMQSSTLGNKEPDILY